MRELDDMACMGWHNCELASYDRRHLFCFDVGDGRVDGRTVEAAVKRLWEIIVWNCASCSPVRHASTRVIKAPNQNLLVCDVKHR